MDETNIFNMAQVEALPITAEQVALTTKRDPLLTQVYHYTQSDWPTEVDSVLLPYWNHQTEFSIERGCLLWSIQVIIPQKLQDTILEELHKDNPGIVQMKAIAVMSGGKEWIEVGKIMPSMSVS